MARQRVLATVIAPMEIQPPSDLRDVKDLPLLRCAVSGHAQTIVTGDKDLLVLKEFQGIMIVTPRIFLAAISV
jgi:hypothetical protein